MTNNRPENVSLSYDINGKWRTVYWILSLMILLDDIDGNNKFIS